MNIPEELLKMSDKELQEVLIPNIYRAKYIIRKDIQKIHPVLNKDRRYFYITENGDRINRGDISYYYSPLTFNDVKSGIQLNIINKIKDWDYTKFRDWCVKQFISVFGEEYVDVQNEQHVVVWFPEITIKNSVEQSHIIRDLYLRFYIGNEYVELSGAKRATLTESEVRNNYMFSHMNGSFATWTKNFCFGDTELATLNGKLQKGNRIDVFRNLFYFLSAIPYYLSWESLEGVPYRKIDDVICDSKRWASATYPDVDIDEIYKKVCEHLQNFTYSINMSEDNPVITISDSSIEEISNIISREFPELNCPYHNGMSVQENTNTLHINEEELKFQFKDRTIEFTLIPSTEEIILPMRAHTELVGEVVEEIENRFKNFYCNKKLNEYQNSI